MSDSCYASCCEPGVKAPRTAMRSLGMGMTHARQFLQALETFWSLQGHCVDIGQKGRQD
jgi:hypothetical protein